MKPTKLLSLVLCLFVVLCVFLVAFPRVSTAEAPATEKAKIEALIANVEKLSDAKFIRNGSDYSASNAAKFLRGKWGRNEKEINTAADFIAKAASTSGAGKPYMIRFKDGTEKACSAYLTEELKKLEAPKEK